MSNLDQALRRALSPEDLRLLDDLSREEPVFIQALNAFQDQHRLIGVIGWIGGFAMFGVGCYFTSRFIQAEDLRSMILWGAAAALAFFGLGMVKLGFLLEMQKNSILREVKRLELQVASLRVIGAGGD